MQNICFVSISTFIWIDSGYVWSRKKDEGEKDWKTEGDSADIEVGGRQGEVIAQTYYINNEEYAYFAGHVNYKFRSPHLAITLRDTRQDPPFFPNIKSFYYRVVDPRNPQKSLSKHTQILTDKPGLWRKPSRKIGDDCFISWRRIKRVVGDSPTNITVEFEVKFIENIESTTPDAIWNWLFKIDYLCNGVPCDAKDFDYILS